MKNRKEIAIQCDFYQLKIDEDPLWNKHKICVLFFS